jgi:hypothetical protein
MASLIFEEGTYTDCTIQSDNPTSTNTSASGKIQKSVSRTESVVFRFERPQKYARFIPFVDANQGSTGEDSHHILVRYTGSLFADIADSCVVETLSVNPTASQATWNNYNSARAWTTAGGRDNVKTNSAYTGSLIAGSSGSFRGLPLGRRQAVHMLTNETTSILMTPILTCVVSFRLEEIGTGSLRPDIVIKGRYATRNRENPIRSRKFGVR